MFKTRQLSKISPNLFGFTVAVTSAPSIDLATSHSALRLSRIRRVELAARLCRMRSLSGCSRSFFLIVAFLWAEDLRYSLQIGHNPRHYEVPALTAKFSRFALKRRLVATLLVLARPLDITSSSVNPALHLRVFSRRTA